MATRVLIIEDNPANHELVAYLLQCAGYATLSAWNGLEGLAVARQACPDIVLCDLQMPEMNGYDAVREFKADEGLRAIPIIAVTASSMSGDAVKALAAGFDGYLSKPIEPETFVQQVEAFLPCELRLRGMPNRS